MKIQEHISKISWSYADKLLSILYGFVTIMQVSALKPYYYGLWAFLISINLFTFVVSDAFALSPIIQFGINPANRRKVNSISLIVHLICTLGIALIIFLSKDLFAGLFKEPNFTKVAFMLPLIVISYIPRIYYTKLFNRDLEYRNIFFLDFIFFAVMTGVTVYLLIIYKHLNFYNMVLIYFSGSMTSSLIGTFMARKKLEFGMAGDIKLKQIFKFVLPVSAYSAIHNLPKQLDIYFLKFFFSTESVGIYFLAKQLFRVFEEGVLAANILIYPSAVRQIENNNMKGLKDLYTKSVSFLFVLYLCALVILELGVSYWIISTFLLKYIPAINQFNLIALAALALPFLSLTLIITASGHPNTVLKYVIISALGSFVALFIAGGTGNEGLMPLGIMVYYFILGIIAYIDINKRYGFPPAMILRSVGDSYNFAKSFIQKRKKRTVQ